MNLQYQNLADLSSAVSLFAVIGLFLPFFEPRYTKKVYYTTLALFSALWLSVNLYILLTYGIEIHGRYMLLTATLPSLLYLWVMAKHRGGRFFFTFCLIDTATIWVMVTTNLIDYAVGGEGLVMFILRMAAFPVMGFVSWHLARKPYLMLLRTAERGWWLFAGMTGIFYLTLAIFAWTPTNLRLRPQDIPAAVMLLILLPLVYCTIFIVLRQQDALFRIRVRQNTFEAQAAMMAQRLNELRDAEERFRYERHDMRHRLHALSALIQQNDTQAALDYIGASRQALDTTAVRRYCSDPALDAILSSYFRRAADLGVEVQTHIDLPAELSVPTAELSTVFANALENMIHAVQKLPEGQRHMSCTCICHPCLMLEFCNTCAPDERLGSDGLPVPKNAGHGAGTRSIVAFAEKHKALCTFQIENGWFRLRLSL